MDFVKNRAPDLAIELLESAVEQKNKTIKQAVEALEMWVKFWNADNDENSLEPLLAEEAMEATLELLERLAEENKWKNI